MLCPICSTPAPRALLQREKTPVLQNAVHHTPAEARAAATGELSIRHCDQCGFVWNSAFNPDRIRYSEGYDNSQTHSEAFLAHLRSRACRIIEALPANEAAHIVEIGCGQGDFIQRLMTLAPTGRSIHATGFDPAYRGIQEDGSDRIRIFPEYFTSDSASRLDESPSVLVSRHTIEHVPDPVGFLKAIRKTLPERSNVKLFLETPDNSWILRHDAFQDFFYEHCSLFDFGSMSIALRKAGFAPNKIETCFEGQYLWVEAEAAPDEDGESQPFGERLAQFRDKWYAIIEHARGKGRVALWGAGAKGATFALMMDPSGELIDAVVDSNPGKQGGFIAVSAHPIIAPEDVPSRDVRTLILMNPNYEKEVRERLSQVCWDPEVVVLR
ncbi:class I SAM-dependent methyltransferase [Microvirga subterranea]|uniref:C-methyltransferase-like protein n=1 Tax=Microvirga subterranea TaxID=186651 RepID=A0A370HDY5_9HYPH|nr:class I SAM-dependent methyltransferase [Microvirga subterranea]RDI54837.1 C-methyltransferase-like protein [Microvirga subterranea]